MTQYLANEFDRLFDQLSRRTIGFDYLPDFFEDWGKSMPQIGNFPPYDINKVAENKYSLTLALAGYSPNDVEVSVNDGRLFVKTRNPKETLTEVGAKPESVMDTFLYKGIAKRSFNLSFALGENMEVIGADFSNGLLTIAFERLVPKEKKPRIIPIEGHVVNNGKIEDKTEKAA